MKKKQDADTADWSDYFRLRRVRKTKIGRF